MGRRGLPAESPLPCCASLQCFIQSPFAGFMRSFFRGVLILACVSPGWCQVITTIVGTDWLFPGDGSQAVDAPIGGSLGLDVATAPDGSFYIADPDNQM